MIGQYRVDGRLGRGGMGEVFAAVHPLIGKRVAIKVIRADRSHHHGAVDRFLQEARAVNQIGHPNIVDVFAFGALPDGRPYLAMERLTGETLRDRLARGPLSLAEIAHICDSVGRALQAAHAKQIVHRDLKPENVFLVAVAGDRPHVKLLDFGLAKLADPLDDRAERTEAGMLLGTPRYLAPEQAVGDAVDARADVYALGAMVFEMVAGRSPFLGSAVEMVAQHLTEPAPRLASIQRDAPRELDELVDGMLAKTPAARPSLAEVREVLARLAQNDEALPGGRARRWLVVALGVAALAGAALAYRLGVRNSTFDGAGAGRERAAGSVLGPAVTPPPDPAVIPPPDPAVTPPPDPAVTPPPDLAVTPPPGPAVTPPPAGRFRSTVSPAAQPALRPPTRAQSGVRESPGATPARAPDERPLLPAPPLAPDQDALIDPYDALSTGGPP
jgi:tRNA A-37 threonylcarbamoyl transferase component Bud32